MLIIYLQWLVMSKRLPTCLTDVWTDSRVDVGVMSVRAQLREHASTQLTHKLLLHIQVLAFHVQAEGKLGGELSLTDLRGNSLHLWTAVNNLYRLLLCNHLNLFTWNFVVWNVWTCCQHFYLWIFNFRKKKRHLFNILLGWNT